MKNILQDIHQYSQSFTISQVIKFFQRKSLTITKSMIQNYVRDGLLPPPVNKRQYTHKHLAVLALVCQLKTVYEMSDVKAALLPLMDGEGIPLEVYREYIQKSGEEPLHGVQDPLLIMIHSVDLKNEAIERLRK